MLFVFAECVYVLKIWVLFTISNNCNSNIYEHIADESFKLSKPKYVYIKFIYKRMLVVESYEQCP